MDNSDKNGPNGWKWPTIDKSDKKWLEIAQMAGNGPKWLEIAHNGWKITHFLCEFFQRN